MSDLDFFELRFTLKDATDEINSVIEESKNIKNKEDLTEIPEQFFFADQDGEQAVKTLMRVQPYLRFNGKEINGFLDIYKLLNMKESIENDDFYLFSCSCGVAGCAGIWEPIKVELNNSNISFIIPENSNYSFLDKNKYTFNLEQLQSEIEHFIHLLEEQLKYMENLDNLMITLDNDFEFDESIKDFLDFYNRELKDKRL